MSNIKLYNSDCLEIMKDIPDNSIDMVLCDPPYGISFRSGRRKNKYENIKNDNNLLFLNKYFEECFRIMKENTAIYCFCSWQNINIFKEEFEKFFKIKNILIWVKNNHGSGDLKASYAPRYEMILYGNKGRRIFEKNRYEDVLFFNKTKNELHPTQKPTDLLEFLIKNSSKENSLILDGFMGSGTTGIACINTNRNFIGIELDENYFNIANKRIKQVLEERDNSV